MKFISEQKQIMNNDSPSVEYYNEQGIGCEAEENAAAKKTLAGSTTKHFVKQSKRQRRLFNPIIDKIDQKSVLRTENEFLFQEVNKECFEEYLKYLKNRNSYFLMQANTFWKR